MPDDLGLIQQSKTLFLSVSKTSRLDHQEVLENIQSPMVSNILLYKNIATVLHRLTVERKMYLQ